MLGPSANIWIMWECLTQDQTQKSWKKEFSSFIPPSSLWIARNQEGKSFHSFPGAAGLGQCHFFLNYSLNPIIPEIIMPKSAFLIWKEIFRLFSLSCRIFLVLGQSWNHGGWRRPPGASISACNQIPTKPHPKVPYPVFLKIPGMVISPLCPKYLPRERFPFGIFDFLSLMETLILPT